MLVIQRPTVEAIDEPQGNLQRFAIGPLEPGFGHTIGNSLRRTLLSSIPGAAITQVRFDDALHEFGTISGVTEDITDIILNLKDLVLVLHGEGPVTLRIDAEGPVEVAAGHIEDHPDVEILNPEMHIASVNGKGRFAADLTVRAGRGYSSAEQNNTEPVIGNIPVDSIYSPVRRVAFQVETTRVEQSTDFDRLVLEVQTDGSISPREALASAGSTLRRLLQLVEEMSGSPRGLELGEIMLAGSGKLDMDLPLESLELTERPQNCLKRAMINTIGQLVERSGEDLLAITNFGQKSLDEVIEKLTERGLALAERD